MSGTDPETEIRVAMIDAIKTNAGVMATALGAEPRVFNRVPGTCAFPFIEITSRYRPWDTSATEEESGRGGEHDVELRLMGEYEGDQEGNAILWAIRNLFLDWTATLIGHRIVNVELKFSDVREGEDAKRYLGLQTWRVVSEEIDPGEEPIGWDDGEPIGWDE
mgnify:FL=1